MTSSDNRRSLSDRRVERRTVAKGLGWAAPVVAVAAAAPAASASIYIVPGINGWNLHTYNDTGWCSHQIAVDSQPQNGGPTPDGAPFGLYLYDVTPTTTIANAQMIYWIRGNTTVTWTSQPGHSCWGSPVQGPSVTKGDGAVYTSYTWTYGCPIDPNNVSPDGRLYLGRFRTTAQFTLSWGICDMACYWAERKITVDGVEQQFERKRGFADCAGQSVNRMAPQNSNEEASDSGEEMDVVHAPDSVAG